ncbi:MAG: epimerase, partial [Gammaproteobacteria bacterium]|nr:epimerase [Gammaproteobacteria bacterium]
MVGRKFGSTGNEELTWAMNAHVPALVAEKFSRSRIVAYSTTCVYPFVPVASGGAKEHTPVDPPGEYAMSCVARERMFEYFSDQHQTPGRLIRLSYAIDMRYGVLHDVAQMVLAKERIDLTTGHANVIWQGDAASQSLRALRHCTIPTTPLNVSGPEIVSIRSLAKTFGHQFGNEPSFRGTEAESAWLADTGEAAGLFGYPVVPLNRLIGWTANWVQRGMHSLDKPTHFEVRSGDY